MDRTAWELGDLTFLYGTIYVSINSNQAYPNNNRIGENIVMSSGSIVYWGETFAIWEEIIGSWGI